MPSIKFDGEAYDTEQRLMEQLRGYCLAFTDSDGNEFDVSFIGYDEAGDILYRDWDAEDGSPVGDQKRIEYESLVSVKVY